MPDLTGASNVGEPPFESAEEQRRVWGRTWGCDSEVGRLRVVLMHPPSERSLRADPTDDLRPSDEASDKADQQWYWAPGELAPRDQLRYADMLREWQHLVDVINAEDVEVIIPEREAGGRFVCYPRDPILPVNGGVIVGRLRPETRRGEERWASTTVAGLGVPIIRTITGTGMMEGGSFAWLTSTAAVVGRSNCVNEEATRQVEQVLQGQGVEVLRVDLAFTEIHLDGVFSMIAPSVALVDVDRVPYSFIEAVHDRGVETIPLGPDDDRWVINSLALRPGTIVMPEGLSEPTRKTIEARGIDIITVPFDAIHENGGGIRCSTSPLARDPVPDTTTAGAVG